jgi:hypothetical protein
MSSYTVRSGADRIHWTTAAAAAADVASVHRILVSS